MWRNFKKVAPLHIQGCKRAFSNYDMSCARCVELANGAKAQVRKETESERMCREIKAHDCKARGCGIVCTFGQW